MIRIPKRINDFWTLNEHLKRNQILQYFSNEINSDKYMVALFYLYDPKSFFVNSSIDEERFIIELETKLDIDLKIENYEKQIKAFKSFFLLEEQSYFRHVGEIKKRNDYIETLSFIDDDDAKVKNNFIDSGFTAYDFLITYRGAMQEARINSLEEGYYTQIDIERQRSKNNTLESIHCFAKESNLDDFWKNNPDLLWIEPYKSFSFTPNSSKIMTAIWKIYDPYSETSNSGIPLVTAKKTILEDIFGANGSNSLDEYPDLINTYINDSKKPIDTLFDDFFNILENRQEYYSEFIYSTDLNRAKIHNTYLNKDSKTVTKMLQLRSILKQSEDATLGQGGYTLSMIEEDYINYYK